MREKSPNGAVAVIFVDGGLTLRFLPDGTYAGDSQLGSREAAMAHAIVAEPGYTAELPAPMATMTEAEQLVEYSRVMYRPLAAGELGVPITEHPCFPHAETNAARPEGLLTIDEVCTILRISRRTCSDLIRRNLIGAERLDPSSSKSEWRVRRSSLRRFLSNDHLGDEELRLLGRPARQSDFTRSLNAAGGTMVAGVASVDPSAFDGLDDDLDEEGL